MCINLFPFLDQWFPNLSAVGESLRQFPGVICSSSHVLSCSGIMPQLCVSHRPKGDARPAGPGLLEVPLYPNTFPTQAILTLLGSKPAATGILGTPLASREWLQ